MGFNKSDLANADYRDNFFILHRHSQLLHFSILGLDALEFYNSHNDPGDAKFCKRKASYKKGEISA